MTKKCLTIIIFTLFFTYFLLSFCQKYQTKIARDSRGVMIFMTYGHKYISLNISKMTLNMKFPLQYLENSLEKDFPLHDIKSLHFVYHLLYMKFLSISKITYSNIFYFICFSLSTLLLFYCSRKFICKSIMHYLMIKMSIKNMNMKEKIERRK